MSDDENFSPPPRWADGALYQIVDYVAVFLVWLFSFVAVAAFGLMLALAAMEFYKSCTIGFGSTIPGDGMEHDKAALITAIHGLEFVFLAPLCYFLIRSLGRQVFEYLDRNSPGSDAKADLVEVKSLIIGLLGGVVAADLVGRAINEKVALGVHTWIELALLAILCGNYYVLHLVAQSIRKEEKLPPEKPLR